VYNPRVQSFKERPVPGLILQLDVEVLAYLEQIRDHLQANPPSKDQDWVVAGPKRPDREGLRIGDHRPAIVGSATGRALPEETDRAIPDADPSLAKLRELLNVLGKLFEKQETVADVPELSRLTKEAARLAEELGKVYKFDSIRLPESGVQRGVKGFSEIRSAIVISSEYFERLDFYSKPEGKDYLRGVVQDHKAKWFAGEEGLVNIKDHNYGERIDPLAAVRSDFEYRHYLTWAESKYGSGFDPVEYIVEYIMNSLSVRLGGGANQARLGTSEDLTPFIRVQIRPRVPGDERFSRGELNRMWTYQVKVAKNRVPGSEWTPGSAWTEKAWAKNAIGLPTLRVVESASKERDNSSDFTKGSLYAIDASSHMYCFGTSKFHSALTNSAPVAAAGILVAEAGRVIAIDNRSGHYQPGFRQLLSAVKYLESNLVLEPDAFVSLYVTPDDAMYFSPQDFIAVADGGLRYVETAAKIAEIAQKYARRLPVPPQYADLIPVNLSDFPKCSRGDRWDLMLTNMYEPLAGIVKDLTGFLRSITSPTAWAPASSAPNTGDHEGAHVAEAGRVLQRIEAGGAVCELRGLVQRLTSISQPIALEGQGALIAANLKYRNIAMELAALRPSHTQLISIAHN
jgi:hypothetical protein